MITIVNKMPSLYFSIKTHERNFSSHLYTRYDNVILIPLVLQLGLGLRVTLSYLLVHYKYLLYCLLHNGKKHYKSKLNKYCTVSQHFHQGLITSLYYIHTTVSILYTSLSEMAASYGTISHSIIEKVFELNDFT